ncbi:MAG: hypothetical protein GKR88_08745 [Flavobacteriaceae bacterium]|nr:MAG: hypothetical protein GKR88_08745 [Flavobacteriaceae bacterium]
MGCLQLHILKSEKPRLKIAYRKHSREQKFEWIWLSIDPAADVLESSSQYVYALNSPIIYLDLDGELPILINGRTSSDSERGDSSYWNAEIIATIKGSGIANPGGTFHYVDGNRGADQYYAYNRKTGKGVWKDANLSTKKALTASSRAAGGRIAASNDFEKILAQLEKDPETGKIVEKIQIYTHSRGGAFGMGYTSRLLQLIKKNSHLFADANNVIEYILHMAPHQSNSINGNKGVKTFGISHTSDILSGNDIENADNVHSNVGNAATSHQNGSFVKELNAFLSAISSQGGATQEAIDQFKKTLEEMGIKFTYKEK